MVYGFNEFAREGTCLTMKRKTAGTCKTFQVSDSNVLLNGTNKKKYLNDKYLLNNKNVNRQRQIYNYRFAITK